MKKIFKVLSILLTFCLIFISVYFGIILLNSPKVDFSNFNHDQIQIFDTNHQKLNASHIQSTKAYYNEFPESLINAVVSIEDQSFFKHKGINVPRIIKASLNNIRDGGFSEGASTITQQLVKNAFLSSKKTINRKAMEITMAIKVESLYTKEQILELYLNNILFGDNVYGIKDAALYYFNRDLADLSVDEAATLAGIIQLPNLYNPYRNEQEALKRRNLVLSEMNRLCYISNDEYNFYSKINLKAKLSKNEQFSSSKYYNSYLDSLYSYNQLATASVETYLNPKIQAELFKIASDEYKLLNDNKLKIAMVCIDNKTSGVLGIIGNRNTDKKVLNYAFVKRQMASTMKPIVDYLPVFEYLNYSPTTPVTDEPYEYSDGTSLKNWDYQFKGSITIRQALRESRNIPALKMYQKIDSKKRLQLMNKLGLYPENSMYESEALGSGLNGYSLFEIVNAYQAFANMGKFRKASFIKETNYPQIQVMKDTTAFFMNSILHDVFKGSAFDLKNTYLCAKTGQTNFDDDTIKRLGIPYGSVKDSYVIAYTKSITFGVWVGYDEVSSNSYLDRVKTQIPRSVMQIFMNKFGGSNEYYKIPDGITISPYELIDNEIYLSRTGQLDYFLSGLQPKIYYKKHHYYEV